MSTFNRIKDLTPIDPTSLTGSELFEIEKVSPESSNNISFQDLKDQILTDIPGLELSNLGQSGATVDQFPAWTGTTWEPRTGTFANLRDFLIDGSSDDTIQVQEWIDYAASNGLTAYIPANTTALITNNISVPSNTDVVGANVFTSIIKAAPSANIEIKLFTNSDSVNGNQNIKFANLTVDGGDIGVTSETQGSVCIEMNNVDGLIFDNLQITQSGIEGIYCGFCNNIIVNNLLSHNNGPFASEVPFLGDASGIHIDASTHFHINNAICWENGFHGIILTNSSFGTVKGVVFGNGFNGVFTQFGVTDVVFDIISFGNFRGAYFISGSARINLRGSIFQNTNNVLTNGAVDIIIDGCNLHNAIENDIFSVGNGDRVIYSNSFPREPVLRMDWDSSVIYFDDVRQKIDVNTNYSFRIRDVGFDLRKRQDGNVQWDIRTEAAVSEGTSNKWDSSHKLRVENISNSGNITINPLTTVTIKENNVSGPVIIEPGECADIIYYSNDLWVAYKSTDKSALWGRIGGNILNQNDLQTELNSKADVSALSVVATSGSFDDLLDKPSTDDIPEGFTNLYHTDARAVSAIKADIDWNATDWDAAFSWGDHALVGYLTSFTETDPTVPSHVKSITSTQVTNWDIGYNQSVSNLTYDAATNTLTLARQNATDFAIDLTDLDGGSGSSTLVDLTDTNITSVADEHILQWDASTSKWINVSPASVGSTVSVLNDLTDVTTTSGTDRDVLVFNSTTSDYENRSLVEADISDLGSYITNISAFTTTDLTEGTNLYHTDARAVSAIKADVDWNATDWDAAFSWGDHALVGYLTNINGEQINALSNVNITTVADGNAFFYDSGTASWVNRDITEADISDLGSYITNISGFTTDDLTEGTTNLYHTDARAVSAIKADAAWNATNWDTGYNQSVNGASFNSTTNTLTINRQTSVDIDVDLSSLDGSGSSAASNSVRQTLPRKPGTYLHDGETGWDDWFIGGEGGTSTDSVTQTSSVTVTTLSGSQRVGVSTPIIGPFDITNSVIRIWVKCTNWSVLTEASLIISSDQWSFANEVTLDMTKLINPPNNEWIELAVPLSDMTETGTLNETNIQQMLLSITDDGTERVTMTLDSVSFIDNNVTSHIISISFDDGFDDTMVAKQHMDKFQYAGTAYIDVDSIGNTNRMTESDLDDLDFVGWDIGGHKLENLTTLTQQQLIDHFANTKGWLNARGYKGSEHYAYPNGAYNDLVISELSKQFSSATNINGMKNAQTHVNSYNIHRESVDKFTSLALVQSWIDDAIANNEWLIINFHTLVSTLVDGQDWLESDFISLMSYLNTNNANVLPVSDAIQRMTNHK